MACVCLHRVNTNRSNSPSRRSCCCHFFRPLFFLRSPLESGSRRLMRSGSALRTSKLVLRAADQNQPLSRGCYQPLDLVCWAVPYFYCSICFSCGIGRRNWSTSPREPRCGKTSWPRFMEGLTKKSSCVYLDFRCLLGCFPGSGIHRQDCPRMQLFGPRT